MDTKLKRVPPQQVGTRPTDDRPRSEQRTIIIDHTGKPLSSDMVGYAGINTHDHDWKMK